MMYISHERQTDRRTFKSLDGMLVKHTAVEDGLQRGRGLTDSTEELDNITMLHQLTHVDQTLDHTHRPPSKLLQSW